MLPYYLIEFTGTLADRASKNNTPLLPTANDSPFKDMAMTTVGRSMPT